MNHESVSTPQRMRTPRAAAVAGIVFSLLLITSMLLIWTSIPADPRGPATDVMNHLKALSFSLNLLPFAGVAFLWFIAVVRDRLGTLEDRFFATVFLGSGLLFIAMMFNVGALVSGEPRRELGGVHATRLRTLLLLMRWSGLRIRDAVTLKRTRLVGDNLLLHQAETGTPVYVKAWHPQAHRHRAHSTHMRGIKCSLCR
jgi:hypothetical protein